ncbi:MULTISPECIES: hypothetical protein [Staphylococcus]|uniref:Uncharacterized protein n=1 Tax=Staphylococcus hsinchuensis TaxID=3051183 RepID=A0ABZ3EAN7_9STAP|nr:MULTISPECIES: hypothetical protein [unclassified Staphylococcus]
MEKKNKLLPLNISLIIHTIFIITSINTIVTKSNVTAELLAIGGLIGFTALMTVTIIALTHELKQM